MKSEVKEKWSAALLSGEYKQGQEALHVDAKFCCLGVLCDLYRKEHPETEWRTTEFGDQAFLEQVDYLPKKVQEWAGLEEANPIMKVGKDTVATLSGLNDQGASFKKIARLIEEQL